jgi:hypothetical protein
VDYKASLWEEIFICIKHIGMTYQDVLSAPTCERRFFLLKLIDNKRKEEESMQAQMESSKTKNSKGTRTTKVGGEQLKNKLKSGEINQGLNPYEKS